MTEENKNLLIQNTSSILSNIKEKEEEIKSEYSKLLSIEYSIYKQNERLGKQNSKSFNEIIKERKEAIEKEYKEYLTEDFKKKLQEVTDKAKEIYKDIKIIKENIQRDEKEYTEKEIQNIIIVNIIKSATNKLKKDEKSIEDIKQRTISRLNEIKVKENNAIQSIFNEILQSQEEVQKFEDLSDVIKEINTGYFNLQPSY